MVHRRGVRIPSTFRGATRRVVLPLTFALTCGALSLIVIIALATPAAAQDTWTGSGDFSFTSTPSSGGSCDGTGTADVSLEGDNGMDTGSLTTYFGYVADACAGDLPAEGSSFTSYLTLSQSGNSLSGSDDYGDSISGSYSGSQLQLTLTVGGGSSGGGGQCVEFCTTVYVFTFTGSGSLFGAGLDSFSGMAAILGGAMGAGGLIGSMVSGRRPRIPYEGASASIEAPATTGFYSNSPAGMGGVAMPTPMPVPDNTPIPPAVPSWAYDYRTAPYTPNPLIQGWPELLQKFQVSLNGRPPKPPNFPFFTEPAPPTGWAGAFCQPRINPQTGQWAWWDPVSGVFPYG
ncbi:MAG: hypothetical protein ABSE66_02345 [Thermoplasmata archaeon]